MNEITLQNLFENFLVKNNIQYKREFKAHAYVIDFKVKLNEKNCGVEIKSSKGNIFHMMGQLILAKKTFSHIYLLAPQEMLERVQDVVESIGIGVIAFKEGEFSFLKEPKPSKYYFNPPESSKKPEFQKPKAKSVIVVDKDYSILVNFENKTFNHSDVVKFLKISGIDAYARIERLLKVGLLKEESSFNPKGYSVKKIVALGTKLPLL